MKSLTRQTVGIALAAQIACATMLCGAALLHEHHTRFKAFDTSLRGRSDSLLGAIQDAEDPGDNVAVDPSELDLPSDDVYAVYIQGGRLLGTSANPPQALIRRGKDGFRDVRAEGSDYRLMQREGIRVIDRAETDNAGLRRPVTILYASPEAHIWREIFEAARFYLITIVLAAIATGFLVSLLLRHAVKPLSDLAGATANLSAPSLMFEAPASALQVRELRPLAEVLTDVVARLRESFAKEHRFVGDAAHELKTAIAVVRSSVQVLMLKRRTEEEYGLGLDRILEDTQRVEALVTQMLQLARLEENIRAHPQAVNLSDAVASVAEKLRPVAVSRGVEVSLEDSQGMLVGLSRQSAEVLVSNLLHNAIQHSQPASLISVRIVREASRCIRLEIADRGCGIGPEALPHIFERFYREDQSRSRDTGGTGLGLAICKSIVDAAGASIEIESTKGVGTRVRITFISP